MQIEWQTASPSDWHADAVLFFTFEKASNDPPGLKRWMEQQGSWMGRLTALKDFQGKFQQVMVYYAPEGEKISRVILTGLGPEDKFSAEKLRNAAAMAFRRCRELQILCPSVPLWAFEGLPLERAVALEETLLGGLTGLYRFNALKTRDVEPEVAPERIRLLTETEPGEPFSRIPDSVRALASGISLARDLTNAPANQATPGFMAETARQLADRYGFRVEVLDVDKARELGMGAFTAVAQGSREPAYMIVLEHAPSGREHDAPIILVGKGITFDTGGISIKPSQNLEAMKHDMAGAASVLGAFKTFGELNIDRRLIGILPCTENMPDGKAYKPGDVIRSLAGLTIEVISTDAEGRMVLCDALAYALRFNPAVMVDIATLTGACIVALGHQVAAVMGNHERLSQLVQDIGVKTGERFWPLPLWDFYFEALKSDVADFKNVGDRTAGAIIGGIFLKQFIPEEIPWAHLDIAGTAWTEKDQGANPKGATGFGVRLLVEMALRWS